VYLNEKPEIHVILPSRCSREPSFSVKSLTCFFEYVAASSEIGGTEYSARVINGAFAAAAADKPES